MPTHGPAVVIASSLVFAALLVAPAQAQTAHFTDGTFANADWTTALEVLNNGGSGSGTQTATGGNPGSYRRTTNTTNNATGFGFSNSVFVFHGKATATFNPSVSGAITSIDYSEASIRISGGQQACGLALKQGGVIYYGPIFLNPSTVNVWATTTQSALTATNFDALAAGVQNPDFGVSGGPIQFGFFRANSTSVGGAGSTTVGGLDGWDVLVVYDQATPASATSMGAVKAKYAGAKAR